jgi:DNA-binding XRE family transcriptional regulator
MNALINNYQIVEQGGKPFVLLPYEEFMAKFVNPIEGGLIPHEIVERHVINDVPIVKCWREYLGMTQEALARKSGVQQPSIARIESNINYKPRITTLEKLAKALNLSLEQLLVDDEIESLH